MIAINLFRFIFLNLIGAHFVWSSLDKGAPHTEETMEQPSEILCESGHRILLGSYLGDLQVDLLLEKKGRLPRSIQVEKTINRLVKRNIKQPLSLQCVICVDQPKNR